MTQSIYNCTQAELYAVARTGWNSYLEFLTTFSAFRGYYDAPFAAAAITLIDDTEALPSDQARYAQVEVLRTELVTLADQCLANWQLLKRYILTSFPEPATKARLEEAGSKRYPQASNYNWEELRMMNVQATNFFTTHNAALIAGNNMPATFPTTYSTSVNEYNIKLQEFIDAEEIAQLGTQDKIIANNSIYNQLMIMFKDGQELFKTNDAVKRQFTFSEVLYLISGAGTSGLRGIITDQLTTLPIPDATVTVMQNGNTVTTDPEGKYRLTPLASGTYTLKILATGYTTAIIPNQLVQVGTESTHSLTLVPEA